MTRTLVLPLIACVAAVVAGCSAGTSTEAGGGSTSSSPGQRTTAAPTSPMPEPTSSEPTTPGGAMPPMPGVTAAEQRRAERAVAQMSLPERAGQVIVASYTGTSAPADLVAGEHLAGVISFSDNIASIADLRRDLARLQRADDRPWPLFTGIDQEGGIVARAGAPLTEFPTFMTYGASGRTDLARAAAEASGEELRATGFTAVFAPDADVTSGPGDPTIGSRSAGSDPQVVADAMAAAVQGYQDAGILPVVKHFPGHGSVPADSHLELPVQDASMRQLRRRDLVPFRRAVEAGAPAVMVAHIDVRAVDPGQPSSVSRKVVGGLLRKQLGFRGLVMTDSMQMAGLTDRYGTGKAAVRALRAGADVLLMPSEPVVAKRALVGAVRDDRLPRRRLTEAATRVVAQLMHTGGTPVPPPSVIGSHQRLSQRVSAAAITVTDGPCQGRLVGQAVQVSGDPTAVGRFERAAREAGLGIGSGDSVALLGYGAGGASADVVVTTDTPYALGASTAPVKIAAFGETPGAMRALVDVLLGEHKAPGRLPVPVDGVSRRGC
ncbi:MAG TPA: glycoside hydrolase family 3 N-terminal domain-containing protein [Nocardioidaceae bacterium]|nr:glycoside hydrolase family 3 N-terminal domain-containing protein [Nocardioidaceae bacterium]